MILAVLVGWSLQRFAGVDGAVLPALLIGMFAALFVPVKGSCAIRPGTPDGR